MPCPGPYVEPPERPRRLFHGYEILQTGSMKEEWERSTWLGSTRSNRGSLRESLIDPRR